MEREAIIELSGVAVYHSRHPYLNSNRRRSYRGGELVLKDVNLTVHGGELVYFIGRVGSGKSTLLKTLYGEIPLVEGRGTVAGFDLASVRRRDIPALRRQLGVVFQDYQLLVDRNVYENLRFVMRATGWRDKAKIDGAITEVLRVVGLSNKEYKMTFELSGGEQQRLAIARALVNRPKVILADEPTGNLDPAATEEIMNLLVRISQENCAVIMSTHNIGNIRQYPSRVIRFSQGRTEEIDIKSFF
ncbi:MAG: ATP-binding cassette domain-containing protein [Rikenellaceae bacterium]|jgi:cell division transport system ATP-binding protein|nr:ATP-binding cassette domain-containing protein [Rikenellaceae bacterium]